MKKEGIRLRREYALQDGTVQRTVETGSATGNTAENENLERHGKINVEHKEPTKDTKRKEDDPAKEG